MTITAVAVITDAYQRCNRLSPGETLSADDAAFGFTRLNLLVDELSAQALFLYRDILTSATASAAITLGTGSWAAIASGSEIVSATADNLPIQPITMLQYNQLYAPTTTGLPAVYAYDGLSTVRLYPVPTGQTIKLQTRTGVATFADQNTTSYTVPPGYENALGACLAVRIAPNIIGKIPDDLLRAQTVAMGALPGYKPAILNAHSFTGTRVVTTYPSILYGG